MLSTSLTFSGFGGEPGGKPSVNQDSLVGPQILPHSYKYNTNIDTKTNTKSNTKSNTSTNKDTNMNNKYKLNQDSP